MGGLERFSMGIYPEKKPYGKEDKGIPFHVDYLFSQMFLANRRELESILHFYPFPHAGEDKVFPISFFKQLSREIT